jgi:predicted kinase
MSTLLDHCPGPPDWRLDWPALEGEYPWVRALSGCPQDPAHHAEGDVGTHTRMVCEALTGLTAWRTLPGPERAVVFAAAVLHDVAKPACTRAGADGRITSPGHARRGAILAREILWRMGVPFDTREQVVALVRHHLAPFHLLRRDDPRRRAFEVSQTARCDRLALLAEADARGRKSPDAGRLLEDVALFAEFCREHDCLERPRDFPSDHSRFLYFRQEGRDPDYLAHDDCRCEVVLLSGLPGAGKDHWAGEHLADRPVISLDGLRDELDVSPAGEQGAVIALARERARGYLREGRPFAWNATNLGRQVRGACIGLFAAYCARVRIVYLEVPEDQLARQNRQRPAAVPSAVIERLLDRWEVPDLTEAHRVDRIAGP